MNEHTSQCHNCGGFFHEAMMADWTICFGCKQREMEEATGEEIFMDSLGIAWTKSELGEAGGKDEVRKLAIEGDARNYFASINK